jgi:hypothetical protein
MSNKRSYIGDAVGQGVGRLVYNVLLVIALLVATIGSVIQINSRAVKPLMSRFASTQSAAPAVPHRVTPPALPQQSEEAAETEDVELDAEPADSPE